MSSTAMHYADLLGPVYSWAAGGLEYAFGRGLADLQPVPPRAPGALAVDLDVTARCADLLAFADELHAFDRPDLIVCMGDTLTHLTRVEQVVDLSKRVAAKLSERGRFVATWRDYSRLPAGIDRFIPVRADGDRILTCFLEECGDRVAVHDILHEREGLTWKTRVGSYRKLRLSGAQLREIFDAAGLHATVEPGPRGMLRLVADRASTTANHGDPAT